MECWELGPPNVPSIDTDVDVVVYAYASEESDDGNQTGEDNPIDDGLVEVSHQEALAQVIAQASQFQSQRHMEAEYQSSADPTELSFVQHPHIAVSSAIPQKTSTSKSDQESNTIELSLVSLSESSQVSHSDNWSPPPQPIPIVNLPADDGYNWRKYGQKVIRGSPYDRNYFRCSRYPICRVKKKIMRTLDGQGFEIKYEGQHIHHKLGPEEHVKESTSLVIKDAPTSPRISERGKGKAVEEKSGTGKTVSLSLKMSDFIGQEQEDSDNSMQIEKSFEAHRVTERDKGKAVSVEEKSGIGEVVRMSEEMFGPVSEKQQGSDNFMYDSTGKQLPINFRKQITQLPTMEENIEVRANTIFLNRDYVEESDPHITTSQQETTLPTASPSPNSTQGVESQPEGQETQDNTNICNHKKRKRFNLFPWRNKK